MAKTFAPQMARLLQHVYKYNAKHSGKMAPVLSAQQATDLATIIAAIANSWLAVVTTEEP